MTVAALRGAKGIGFRPELASELLMAPDAVDFVEIVAEACFAQGPARREAVAISKIWPVVPHGVKLSLGSAEGIDKDRIRRLGSLARELHAPVVTEHVALTCAGGREIGHLTPIPRSMDAVRAVAANVAVARSLLPDVPFLLENIAVPFGFQDDSMSESDFYCEIVEKTGCALLLDVANLYANAVNEHRDPLETARNFPLERVGMVHLAGGVFEDGFYFDSHAHAVPDDVFAVLEVVLGRALDVPIVLERDANFEVGAGALVAELTRAQSIRGAIGRGVVDISRAAARDTDSTAAPCDTGALVIQQAELAELLTSDEAPSGPLATSIGFAEIERARQILGRKRVEDAILILPALARREDIRPLAEAVLRRSPRGRRKQGVADAFDIARAALALPRLADAAKRDLLVLRARFRQDGSELTARRAPFVGSDTLSSGDMLWVAKGFGVGARVRLHERRHRMMNGRAQG